MSALGRSAVLCAALVVLAGLLASSAAANGDPASHVLVTEQLFAPDDESVPLQDAEQLLSFIRDAQRRGFAIRVALVGKRDDLGLLPDLWRRPQRYSEVLGTELRLVYEGPLLIVMPNGYGIARRGKPLPADGRILAAIPVPAGEFPNLPAAALEAVRRLARARGIRLVAPAPAKAAGDGHDGVTTALVAAAITLLASAAVVALRGRRPR
jgi:hypothetical protein